MTLKKLIESTTAASNQSWITQSITFIAGWWKSSPKGTLTPSATTRTPRPRAITNRTQSASFFGDSARAVLFWLSMSRSLVALMLIFGLSFGGTVDAAAQSSKHHRKSKKPKSPPCRTGCKPETSEPQVAADTPEDEATQKELSELARALHNAAPGAYEKLSAFAAKNATNVWGARAALALGYDEYMKNRSGQAVGLFVKAQNDTLLREYALYWTAQAQRALGRNADAYKVLQTVLHDYPTTAMREQVLEAFAPTAVQLGHAQEAIDALEAYSGTATKPTLLFERAHAYQAAHQLARAAKDYQTVFYKYPLADEAKPAGSALSQVMHALGKEYAYPGVEMQEQRAQAFYDGHKWNEDGLMAAGNYHWVELEREKAAVAYQRVLDSFPNGKYAFNCEWRIAWVAYLDRQPDADDRLTNFLLKYPVSSNSVDALYWLGRNAERNGNPARARSLYNKAAERFPLTYFGNAAPARHAKLGTGEENPPEFLEKIPPPPSLRSFDEPIPVAVGDRWARAQALRAIAFDSSAEQELKNAYFATSSSRFLLEAAQAAFDQGHYGAGMAYARIVVPNFDSRKFNDVPVTAWKALYPLPYEDALRREAAKNDFDPMFAAGLIRQESTFQADAVSHANAIGLMQVLPKTGKLLARQLRVRYTKNKLFEPDFNIEVGMAYIANLVRETGALEYAAAAYNAGEDRIAAWKAERDYEEIPELVESIPFTETREYVQVVLRNTEVYRMIYGQPSVATQSATGQAR